MTGTGTLNDPYIISDEDDLQAIEDDLDAYYELSGNIDATATSGWNGGAGFLPISAFTGYLDGKTYTVSNLTINRTTNGIGLFQQINNTGAYAVRNFNLAGNITGNIIVGSIVGTLTAGLIDNCVSSVVINGTQSTVGGFCGTNPGGTITNCSATGSVTNVAGIGSGGDVGGFVGNNASTITSCYATGAVDCNDTEDYVGGFVGKANTGGSISKCYATGAVTGGDNYIGGFAGYNVATIANCYARGAVTGDGRVGGFIGYSSLGTIDDCFSTGAPTGNTNVGGFVGDNGTATITTCFWDIQTSTTTTSDGGSGKTTAEMKVYHIYLSASWDFKTVWKIDSAVNNGYPSLGQITSIAERDLWLEGPYLCYYDAYGNKRKIEGLPAASGLPWHYFT